MLFSSGAFLFYFLPVALIGYHLAGTFGKSAVIGWLTFMSLVFYSCWNIRFTWFLLASVLVNFGLSHLIAKAQRSGTRKMWLAIGVTLNLFALCYFKYAFPLLGFVTSSLHVSLSYSTPVLPLGISFFTFTQIAYLIDLSQDEATLQRIGEYGLFVTFFPHLVAGPILHHREIMPQFERKVFRLQIDDLMRGMSWFILGLAKKVVIADHVGSLADPIFRQAHAAGFTEAWVGVLSYSMQLYFDFSGYSDMAIGLALMFSIRFPLNFNSPYKSANIIDFWSRWHMTLTRYLTLYLYNPLLLSISRRRMAAGKKVSQKAQRTFAGFTSMVATPILVTMFLAGVWHGAGLQFLIFGLLHGIYLTVNHAWRIFRAKHAEASSPAIPTHVAAVLLTYVCVLVGQVFFRANSTADAISLLRAMVGMQRAATTYAITPLSLLLLACFVIVWFFPNTQEIMAEVPSGQMQLPMWRRFSYSPTWRWAWSLGLLFFFAILFVANSATFLYFQF